MRKTVYIKPSMQLLTLAFAFIIFTFTPAYSQVNKIITPNLLVEMYSTGDEISNPKIPYNIFISNPSSTSFTVNWFTKEETNGSVVYAVNIPQLSKQILDKRDNINSQYKRTTHSVDVVDTDISPGDTVYFKIIADNIELLNNGENFSFVAPSPPKSPPSPKSQSGILETTYLFDKEKRDFLILARVGENSTWITTLPSASGNGWNLSVGNTLTQDLTSYSTSNSLDIEVFGEQNGYASVKSTVSETPLLITIHNSDLNNKLSDMETSDVKNPDSDLKEANGRSFMNKLPNQGLNVIGTILISLGAVFMYKLVRKIIIS